MPPTLDLSRTAHAKVIVSPARLNLRRAASYNHEKGPLSSTSSRFNFNHLLFASPPPSPGLPQLVTRKRKPSNAPRPSKVFRLTLWLFGVAFVLYIATTPIRRSSPLRSTTWTRRPVDEYEMVGQDDLPDFPTPIVITDRTGRAKWTVSIPPNYDFPLSTKEYTDVCFKCQEVAGRVNALHHHLPGDPHMPFSGHGKTDKYFVDVHEAEDAGYLPGSVSIGTLLSQQRDDGDLIGERKTSLVDTPVCARSMTFVLASSEAGMGRTLMLLWMTFAQAQKEGRSFFIDDTRWAYGKYTNIFAAPPVPGCRPPLRHEMLPCPRQARHRVVTSETARHAFAGTTADIAADTATPAERKAMFRLARTGYEALFRLNQEDQAYVAHRIATLHAETQTPSPAAPRGLVVGVHVRRGDRHPLEFQYRESYIPLTTYAERARELLNASAHAVRDEAAVRAHSLTLLASDDPLVYEAADWISSGGGGGGAAPAPPRRAQEQIRLASKAAIHAAHGGADRAVLRRFVDETFGWEGGFFAAMFWNLGRSTLTAEVPGSRLADSAETLRLRGLVGRAYAMDLAVLAGASDGVVCAVSAMGCRLLGVMMGWEGVEGGRWVNVDGEEGWRGVWG